jgi:hypothetical protein
MAGNVSTPSDPISGNSSSVESPSFSAIPKYQQYPSCRFNRRVGLNRSGSCLRPSYADLNSATIQATDADIDEHRPIRVKPSGTRSRVLDRSEDGVQVNRRWMYRPINYLSASSDCVLAFQKLPAFEGLPQA